MATKDILTTVKTALQKHTFKGTKSTIQCDIETSSKDGPIKLENLIKTLVTDLKKSKDTTLFKSIFDNVGVVGFNAKNNCMVFTTDNKADPIVIAGDKNTIKITTGKLELTIKFVLRTSTENKTAPKAEIKKKKIN